MVYSSTFLRLMVERVICTIESIITRLNNTVGMVAFTFVDCLGPAFPTTSALVLAAANLLRRALGIPATATDHFTAVTKISALLSGLGSVDTIVRALCRFRRWRGSPWRSRTGTVGALELVLATANYFTVRVQSATILLGLRFVGAVVWASGNKAAFRAVHSFSRRNVRGQTENCEKNADLHRCCSVWGAMSVKWDVRCFGFDELRWSVVKHFSRLNREPAHNGLFWKFPKLGHIQFVSPRMSVI